ncbi:MAG: diguanylate cyclase [Oscillospiraceae bacterium]|nr:diguanylate cyclase [Oscillospiraceae bacterium]
MSYALHALSGLLTDTPWYFMMLAPFRGSERFKRRAVYALTLLFALVRVGVSYFVSAYAPGGMATDDSLHFIHPLLMLAVCLICHRASFFKVAFTLMVTITMASGIRLAAYLAVHPFSPKDRVELTSEPLWILIAVALFAAAAPFVYRFFGGLLRRTFNEFFGRQYISLTAAPAMFFALYNVYDLTEWGYDNLLVSVLFLLSGLLCIFTNTSLLSHILSEKELNASNTLLDRQNTEKTVLLAAMYQSVPAAIFSKDADGLYTSCNAAFEQMTGLHEDDLSDKLPAHISAFDEKAADSMLRADERVIREGITVMQEEEFTHPESGVRRVMEIVKTPLVQDGKVTGLLGVARDITQQRRYMAMLTALNRALQALVSYEDGPLDDIMAAVIRPIEDTIGLDRVSVFRNKEVDGVRRPGMVYSRSRTYTNPQTGEKLDVLPDTPAVRGWVSEIYAGRILNKRVGDMPPDEAEFLRSIDVRAVCMVPIFSAGGIWGAVTLENLTTDEYFEDGTAEIELFQAAANLFAKTVMRVETEEYSKLMLQASPLCCQLFNRGGNIIDCNDAALKLFGFPTKEALTGRWYKECLPPAQPNGADSRALIAQALAGTFDGGRLEFECAFQAPDLSPIPAEVTLVRIRHRDDYIAAAYVRDLREHRRMMNEIEQHTNLLHTVNRVSSIMLMSHSEYFEDDLLYSLGIMAKAADADRVYIWKNFERDGELYCSQVYEWSEGASSQKDYSLAIETNYDRDVPGWKDKLAADICITGVVSHMSEPEKAALEPQGIKSILVVPIFFKEHFWGFVGYDDCHNERLFTEKEEMVLRSASQLIANTLARHEDARRARKAEERMKLMLDATPLGCKLWDVNLSIVDCNEAAAALFGFDSKEEFIGRFDELSPEYQPGGQRSAEVIQDYVKRAFLEGRMTFEWMHQTPDGDPVPVEVTLVRVEHGDDFVVAAYLRDLREIKTLEVMAEEVNIDPLTGIYNRRYLDRELNTQIRHLSRRTEGLLSVMMLDIDHFKLYNDTYGHTEGDKCLVKIAEIINSCAGREQDFCARYGGEEFTVVLPNTDEHGACMIAERILRAVRDTALPHSASDVADCVTVSIGVTTGVAGYDQSGGDYLRRADELLYKSKQGGRDRYTFSLLI